MYILIQLQPQKKATHHFHLDSTLNHTTSRLVLNSQPQRIIVVLNSQPHRIIACVRFSTTQHFRLGSPLDHTTLRVRFSS